MTLVLVAVAFATGAAIAWHLRTRLADKEARVFSDVLSQAVDDFHAEHNRWAGERYRATLAEETLRQHGIEKT